MVERFPDIPWSSIWTFRNVRYAVEGLGWISIALTILFVLWAALYLVVHDEP